uniref:Uncharacterized protein n=1 Tax=Aegilops tauschii subsp. strangulata TaxID=200361 RepID=A0A453I6S0_AEGTS
FGLHGHIHHVGLAHPDPTKSRPSPHPDQNLAIYTAHSTFCPLRSAPPSSPVISGMARNRSESGRSRSVDLELGACSDEEIAVQLVLCQPLSRPSADPPAGRLHRHSSWDPALAPRVRSITGSGTRRSLSPRRWPRSLRPMSAMRKAWICQMR